MWILFVFWRKFILFYLFGFSNVMIINLFLRLERIDIVKISLDIYSLRVEDELLCFKFEIMKLRYMYLIYLQIDIVVVGVIVGISGQFVKDEDLVLDNVVNVIFLVVFLIFYDLDDIQVIKGIDSVYNIMMDRFYFCIYVLFLLKIFFILIFILILFL